MSKIKEMIGVDGFYGAKVPTLYITGCPAEFFDEDNDELTLVSFFKEYPNEDFNTLRKKFETLNEEGTFDDIEFTLDMEGDDLSFGFFLPDEGDFTKAELKEIFKKVVEVFESGKGKKKESTSKNNTPLFDTLLKLSAV